MTWVWEHSDAKGADLLVLLAIADHAGDDGRDAWPSQATLGKRARIARRSVQRAIASLVEMGELAVDEHAGGTHFTDPRHRPNRYSVLMDKGRHSDASKSARGDIHDAKGRHSCALGATCTSHESSLIHPEPSARQGATSVQCGKCNDDRFIESDAGWLACPQCNGGLRDVS